MESVLDKGSELLDSWGHLSVQDQYLPPQFSSLADLYNCLCGLERLNQRSYFTPFFLLAVSRGRGQKRAVCVCFNIIYKL